MKKIDLLKEIGFSDEFLKKLDDFQNNVQHLKTIDLSTQKVTKQTFDSANIIVEKTHSNSVHELHFNS